MGRNDDSAAYQIVSVSALAQTMEVDMLPSLPALARETAMDLPHQPAVPHEWRSGLE